VSTAVTILQSSKCSVLVDERLCTVHSFCKVFGQYPMVQKLVNEHSGDPSTNARCTFGLMTEKPICIFLTHY
jgi:hypothetical protein